LRIAKSGLATITAELQQYASLRGTLNSYLPLLRNVRLAADELRHQNQETSNKSLVVAGFLSELSSKAQATQLGFTADDFARRVLDIQQAIQGHRPRGIMWDEPSLLEDTLQMIASSSVPLDDGDDLM
jgi:hypothetical protein